MARCSLLLVTAAAALQPLPLHTPLRTSAAPRVICLRESPWMSPITVEAPGLNGGDLWAGARGSDEEFEYAISEAMSMTITAPIIPQFYPQRRWLWRKWRGTILPRVLPREVAFNVGFAIACVLLARLPATVAEAPAAAQILRTISGNLRTVDKVWLLTSGLVSFTLSFFLTQSYAFWRSVYSSTRKVQGRLNDIGLLCAGAAERDSRGEYTESAEQLLSVLGRYVRLYSMMLYSSCTTRFAVLQTPRGLGALVDCGALTTAERTAMLQTGMGSNAVLMWMSTLLNSGLSDGRLGGSPTGGQPLGLQLAFQQCFTELRGCSASIADELTGRMPLAYTQLVQIMADLLIAATPFALLHSVGGVGAVVGTALVTFFHSSILYLAKMFLDPLNNDQYSSDMGINVATLMQETNLGSERWRKSAQWDDLAWHERAKKAAEDASKAVKEANDKASQAFVESGAKAKLNETARHAQREAQRNWVFLTEVSDKVAANAEDAVERRMFDLQQQAFNFFKLSDEMIKTLEEMAWNLLQIAILLLATRYFSADLMLLILGIVLLSGSGLITCFLKFVWFLLWLAAMAPQIFLLFLFVALFVRSRTRGVLMRACGIEDDALSKVSGTMSDACLDAWKLAASKTTFIRIEDLGDNSKDAALDPAMATRLNEIEAKIDELAKRVRVP